MTFGVEVEMLGGQESKSLIWREDDTLRHPPDISDPGYCVPRFRAASGRFHNKFKFEAFLAE